jgi:hypothetical protein
MIFLDTSIYLMLLIEYLNVKTAKVSLSCHIATKTHKMMQNTFKFQLFTYFITGNNRCIFAEIQRITDSIECFLLEVAAAECQEVSEGY